MNDDSSFVLAVDLGTSGPKVALFSVDGRLVDHEIEPTRLILLPGGGAEQDPDDWWRAVVAAARRLLARVPGAAARVRAIGCTAQWSGTVAVDAAGQHLGNAIIWMDSRGSPHIDQVLGGLVQIEGYAPAKLLRWLHYTGGVPGHHGKDSIAHILYLMRERPEVFAATQVFLEPKDYLNLRLTGRAVASVDSITLHWLTDNRDLRRVRYLPRLLALTGVPRDKLPDLVQPTDVIGTLTPAAAQDLGLPAEVKVVAGSGDVHSAAIGSGGVRDYEAHIYLGTSSWISCHVPFQKADVLHGTASIPSGIPGRYFIANEQETACACLDYLRDKVLYPDDALAIGPAPADAFARMEAALALSPPGADGVLFLPHLNGERAPVDDHRTRAAFFNQSLRTERRHLVRAVYEGVALNSRWLLRWVERLAGRRFEALRVIGGGASSGPWCQIFADVLDREIWQVRQPRLANARGAAFQACVGLGSASFEQLAARAEVEATYTPAPAHRATYDALFAQFLALYKATRPIHRALNGR